MPSMMSYYVVIIRREEIIGRYMVKLLEDYTRTFAASTELGDLANTERRFGWLKKQLKIYSDSVCVVPLS